jgi:hypothetical protein
MFTPLKLEHTLPSNIEKTDNALIDFLGLSSEKRQQEIQL